jgi:prokaryotic YEATS domain
MDLKLPSFDPGLIKSPIQLLGVLALMGLVIVGASIWGVTLVNDEPWLTTFLILAALAVFGVMTWLIFTLLTKHREVMLADPYFDDFKADVTQVLDDSGSSSGGKSSLEELRVKRYEQNRGLFLSHVWRRLTTREKFADIEIFVREHPGPSMPLTEGRVEFVEYQLGPKFSKGMIRQLDPADGFRLDVRAYAPMLCIAQVKLRDPEEVLRLYRYIDFPPIEPKNTEALDRPVAQWWRLGRHARRTTRR